MIPTMPRPSPAAPLLRRTSLRPRPRLARLLAPALAWLSTALAPLPTRAGPPSPSPAFESLAATFRREMDNDKPEARLRAMQRAAGAKEPAVVDLLMSGVARELVRRAAAAKAQTETEAALEAALNEITKLNATSPRTGEQIEAYNKRMAKLEAKRDEANARLRELAVDQTEGRGVLDAGVRGIAAVLDALPATLATPAFERVTAAWAGPKSPPDDRVRWVDVASAVKQHPFSARLHDLVVDEAADPRVRVAALEGSIAREEPTALQDAIACLGSGAWNLVAAAVDGLARMHRREAIEPLIELLGRKDAGRTRADAQRALRSLTGQGHGPYRQPWHDWWEGEKARFQMPPKPTAPPAVATPEKGVTFYGVTTPSDKILFILDVSGSMLEPAHPDAAGARADLKRIDLARKELAAAIDLLDESKRFNVILFSHRVVRWQLSPVEGDRSAADKAKRFALDTEAAGGTNIHDALETAFKAANTAADGKSYLAAYDTFFFMTDGTPTAGKLQKPDEILAAVREWNRTAKVVIHCVGVGDAADADFLGRLAAENGGVFVKR